MSDSTHLTGRVESLLPGGEAWIRAEDKTFLIGNVVPDDVVLFQPVQKRRGALRGQLVEVVTPSSARVEPRCPVAETCGGCALQYLDSRKHAEIKSGWVSDAFRQSLTDKAVWIPASEHVLLRRRLRWYVGQDKKGSFLGFRARNSHAVVRHDHCICATDELNLLRSKLEASAAMISMERYESIQVLQLHDGIHLVLEGDIGTQGFQEAFEPVCDEIANTPLQWWYRDAQKTVPLIKPVQTFHDLLVVADKMELAIQIGPDDFIQGQAEGNRLMIQQIVQWSEGASFVVDLFCGVGNFSLPVAKILGSRVVGAELNRASVRAANANARKLNLDASYVELNLFETFDVETFAGADILILDPPRRGAKKVCEMMGRLLPAKIIMVNCDVASGGRDAAALTSLGYRLHTLRALDIFPYTGHVEAMSLWVR